jgi:hypothetical protein
MDQPPSKNMKVGEQARLVLPTTTVIAVESSDRRVVWVAIGDDEHEIIFWCRNVGDVTITLTTAAGIAHLGIHATD